MTLLSTLKFITTHPLNKNRRLDSILEFAKWQVASRLVAGPWVFPWINGSQFLVAHGETGFTGNIYTGLHEFMEMAYLLHVLREDDLFVDVGANVGSYTVLACAAVGASGIAFEPVPATFSRLCQNVRINNMESRVRCINMGVSDEPGVIAFTSASDTTNHALAPAEECDSPVLVEVVSLDAALRDFSPSAIKIDVEGFEASVISGAINVLSQRSLHSVIIELNGSGQRYGFDEGRILEIMKDFGFGTYSYDPFARALVDIDGKCLSSSNTIFVRDKSHVELRLWQARPVLINGFSL